MDEQGERNGGLEYGARRPAARAPGGVHPAEALLAAGPAAAEHGGRPAPPRAQNDRDLPPCQGAANAPRGGQGNGPPPARGGYPQQQQQQRSPPAYGAGGYGPEYGGRGLRREFPDGGRGRGRDGRCGWRAS